MAGITTAIPSSAVCRVPRKNRAWRALRISISVGITVAIFALVIPKVADYSQVWGTIAGLSVWEVLLLALVMTLHLFTYWPQQTAAMPGLTLGQAAVNAQTTTSIANVLPGGPPVAVAFSYCIYRSWGFTKAEIVLQAMLTGIWNIYVKLALPVIAIVVLAFYGHFSIGLFVAAVIGAGVAALFKAAEPVTVASPKGVAGVPTGKGFWAKSEGFKPPAASSEPAAAVELAGVVGVVGRFAAY